MSTGSDVDTINSAITATSDPRPAITPGLPTEIELLRGLGEKQDDGSETWHTVAKVKELTGEDEEALATLETKKDITYTEYMNALLERAVTHIGTLEVKKLPGIMNKLILADRDMLFLGVVRATYGINRDLRVRCPHCSESNDVQIDLDEDFPIRRASFDLRDTMKVTTSKGVVQLRLPNGEDTVESQKKAKTDAEINTAMLSRCAVFEEGEEPEDRIVWAKGLNIGDRRKLVNALLAVKLGPDLEEVETQCSSCGEPMPMAMDWVSLLFG
jgi:hypothetical protein